ncbi:DNA mismatch repair protein MutL [Desulfobaculum xiamenense]|uniref:DNA mismatch repair protein MutL n=1 Tax=Desulfobaculum xiamenense TaxID=995050 RepID=A0A846QP85_9BACT|nr:DNA mismatch repair endonuclease MutL [Desulfobaculum xiamenense]NJB67024.1 DNA mismatch repair protein MutL [Desulfobaculum xiamenense]
MSQNTSPQTQRPIRILSPELQNQIAAGEVVERPASVLKELAENSLDAGAESISIAIEQGGQGLIDIQDDGWGMAPDEMELALTRHATSKVTDFHELNTIRSFGFRGEALPSIASVSRMRISSIARGADTGAFIDVDAGRVTDRGPAALRAGTRIEIRDLFANVPARLKFLKAPTTETRRCQEAFFRLALTRLDVRMTLTVGGRKVYAFTPGQDISKRLCAAWPPAVTDGLIPFDHEQDGYRAHGVTGSPRAAQARADRLLFYVNNRPVTDKVLMRAVREAYSGRILTREYPQAVVFLEMPPEHVDANVHPAKTEVRFRDEHAVFSVIRRAILSALDHADAASAAMPAGHGTFSPESVGSSAMDAMDELPSSFGTPRPAASFGSGAPAASRPSGTGSTAASGFDARPGFATYHEYRRVTERENLLDIKPDPTRSAATTFCEPEAGHAVEMGTPAPTPFAAATAVPARTADGGEYLGQLANTYLIIRHADGTLALVDQHAAHERVLFHTFEKAGERGDSQPLALPIELSLHPAEVPLLEEIWGDLLRLGFSMERPSETVLAVTAIPALLTAAKARDYLRSALSEQSRGIRSLWAMLSCKAAVKANQPLARDEALALLSAWCDTPDRDYCPHGRPIRVSWSIGELERLFKRKA